MKLTIVSPTRALVDATQEELEKLELDLTYTDLSAQHQLKRLAKNHWFKNSNPLKWQVQYNLLKEQVHKCLVFRENGLVYIRPGSIPYLKGFALEIEDLVKYPKPKKIPWYKPLPWDLYGYQKESVEKLIRVKHGNVSLTTGSGKSACLLSLCRETGFRCAIVAPSRGIFNELVEKFEHHFGKGKIGKFGDGKKKLDKQITICIGDSLCNIEKGTKEWEFFSNLEMICVDESHAWAADSLETVCHGLFAEVPWRFFLSATQTRGDGGVKLLQSIIGETVHSLTTKEAVDGGFICKHDYRIVEIPNNGPPISSSDALEIKRQLFLRNKDIANFTAKLCNALGSRNQQILVLVEELGQIAMLAKRLTVPFAYAHSESNKQRLAELGLEKVNVAEQIEKFNKNEVKILIGTSCLHVGVNIFSMTNTVNWVGGASEIKTRQAAIGRSIRLAKANPYHKLCGPKECCTIWDFDVRDNYVLQRHLEARLECYKDSGSEIKYIKLK